MSDIYKYIYNILIYKIQWLFTCHSFPNWNIFLIQVSPIFETLTQGPSLAAPSPLCWFLLGAPAVFSTSRAGGSSIQSRVCIRTREKTRSKQTGSTSIHAWVPGKFEGEIPHKHEIPPGNEHNILEKTNSDLLGASAAHSQDISCRAGTLPGCASQESLYIKYIIPVVPHKAVAEVSKIGNL